MSFVKRVALSALYKLRRIPIMIRNPSWDEEDEMLYAADPELMTRVKEIIRILTSDEDDIADEFEDEEEELSDFVEVHAKVIALRRRLGLPIITLDE
ncbi:unnamed protein product [Peniophora sp. CBMAI 1063]|nr:unnamed protein product [Peniophora sp. CBMAI 1063]